MGTKEEKIKYLLFNRRRIGKFENGGVYIRDIEKHTWEYSSYDTHNYLGGNDGIEEEID